MVLVELKEFNFRLYFYKIILFSKKIKLKVKIFKFFALHIPFLLVGKGVRRLEQML